jgi:hypothetical protein
MLQNRKLIGIFDDFADDLEDYIAYIRLENTYSTNNRWINFINTYCIEGNEDIQFVYDEMLEQNIKSLAPKMRAYNKDKLWS